MMGTGPRLLFRQPMGDVTARLIFFNGLLVKPAIIWPFCCIADIPPYKAREHVSNHRPLHVSLWLGSQLFPLNPTVNKDRNVSSAPELQAS